MPTTDTPPAAPTADDYRAALALIDSYTFTDGYDPRAASDMRAVFAVARAAVAGLAARDRVKAGPQVGDTEAWRNAGHALDAAVADLVALAKGGA